MKETQKAVNQNSGVGEKPKHHSASHDQTDFSIKNNPMNEIRHT